MSLEGIFDPLVRAFFETNGESGGDSGGGESIKAMLIESADGVVEMNMEDITFYRIGTYIPTVEEMKSAVLVVNAATGGGAMRVSIYKIDDVTAEMGFTFYLVYSDNNVTVDNIIVVVGEDVPEEGVKAGTYLNSAFCMFPAVSGLIFGV